MKSLHRIFPLVLSVVVLGGCALSPQTVNVQPSIDTAKLGQTGNGRSVALDVADDRGTPVIGTRGGIYSKTSEIRTAADIKTSLRNETARALQAMGYRVVAANGAADASLKVIIDSIDYTAIGENVVKAVEVAVTLRIVSKVDNREYTGRYRGRRSTDVLTAPDTEKNEKMINAAVSHVLERVLADTELHKFMRG